MTITGVDNDVDAADKTVTVSGTVSATSVTAPVNRTLTLEDDDAATPLTNNAPVFDDPTAEREVPENSAAGTDVGDPIPEATDADTGDTLEYSLEGEDARLFDFDASTRQITTKANVTYDYEAAKNSYEVAVKADDGRASATLAVTIRLTDVAERPSKPAPPTLSPISGSSASLTATWEKPGLNGGPDIIGYEVQYRQGTGGSWMNFTHSGAALTTTITGLTANTEYQVRVRARNGETRSDWSDPSDPVSTDDPGPTGPPRVTSVVVASTPHSGDTYRLYETMLFTVSFSEPVELKPHGRLRLEVGLDNPGGASGRTVQAVFSRITRSQYPTDDTPQIRRARHMHFEYKVQLFDRDANGVSIGANALGLASGARIRSEGGVDAELDHAAVGRLSDHKVDGSADVPMIERIRVVSTPRLQWPGSSTPDTYGEGENIRIGVRFDQPVHVEGEPTMALEVGDPCGSVCEARYESGSGTDTLVFAYLVLANEIDRNGIAIPADPIEVVYGDSIRNDADQEAHLSFRREGTQSGHKVDGSRAAGPYLSVEDAEAHEADRKMDFTVRLEPHGLGIVTVDYATRDGSARAGSDYTETRGTLRFNSLEMERTVSVPIIDDAHDDDGETFTLRLSNPEGAALRSGEREATGTIRNSDPEATPLTASFENVPSAHDGESAFRFRVAFSEPIAISFRSLREDAFAVTGGRVTRGTRVDGRKDLFEITVEPEGAGEVAITLPAGRECSVSGAICTWGPPRKPLTNTPTTTVAGPVDDGPEPNTPAMGAPAIGGTPRVGDELTASTLDISDADGMDDAGFAYQWIGGDRDISGATGSTYTAVAADEGERLKVRVDFTDDAGNRESLTSAATDAVEAAPRANSPAQGRPTIAGTARVGETLSVSTSGISDADGLEDAAFAYQWIRGGAAIAGATGATYAAADADEGERLKVRVDFTDDAGNRESLTSAATDAVEAAPRANSPAQGRPEIRGTARVGETLTASTSGISDADGLEDAAFAYQWIRGNRDIGGATGSSYTAANADEGERLKVRVRFTDDAGNRESVTSGSTKRVAGRPLPKVSVADARVHEAAGATLDFAVTLSAPPPGPVTVDYRTVDASAKAGEDYEARAGTLAFAAGETEKTLRVTVLDDAVDEGEEKMVVVLDPGPGVARGDRLATGTIENHDPMPRALLARFGRTAAVHVVEHVEERLEAPRAPGFRGRFAGRELRPGMERDMALGFLRQLQGMAGAGSRGADSMGAGPMGAGFGGSMGGAPAAGAATLGMSGPAGGGGRSVASAPLGGSAATGRTGGAISMGAGPLGAAAGPLGGAAPAGGGSGPDEGFDRGRLLRMGIGGGDVLTGSDFALNRETRGGILSIWSRGAQSRFSGREGALSLGGDVRTTMFGADYAKGPLVAGLSLSNSRGLGEYTGASGGQVASSVTGLYPWLGYQATERVKVWGVAGYGTGGMLLTPQSGQALESGLSMAMAAAGTRGELVAEGAGGFALAFKADALWVGTAIDGVDGPAGRLKATDAAVTRFRTGLEGSRAYTLGGRLSLRPSVEVGLRHDGGDAETGAGMDVGVGLVVSDAGSGLAVDVRVRTLLVHQDKDFSERGVAVSSELQPDAVFAAGLYGAGGALVGRSGDERGRGAVGPRDDGGHGPRRRRAGQQPRRRGGLRAAGGESPGGHAEVRVADLRAREGLPAGLQPRGAQPRAPGA